MLKGLLFLVFGAFYLYGYGQQTNNFYVQFAAHPDQKYGFDSPETDAWKKDYTLWKNAPTTDYYISVKSIGKGENDIVRAQLIHADTINMDSLRFWVAGSDQEVVFSQDSKNEITLFLPPLGRSFTVSAWYRGFEVGRLKVVAYTHRKEKVVIVPLSPFPHSADSVETRLNKIFRQANISIDLKVNPVFVHDEWKNVTLYDNPSDVYERYTNQMHDLRDAYLEAHPDLDKKTYYIFVIPGFENQTLRGFMLRNKGLGFVKSDKLGPFSRSLAYQLAHGMGSLRASWEDEGPQKGSTSNLMDVPGGKQLRYSQWEKLRYLPHSYSLFDSYEDVRANNGFVAYYFWKEDQSGNIQLGNKDNLLKSIKRPYKKNYLSYHLDIDNFLFIPLFYLFGYMINLLHLLATVVLAVVIFYYGRKLGRKIKERFRRWRLMRFSWRIIQFAGYIVVVYFLFLFINLGYTWFEVHNGRLPDLDGMSFDKAIDVLEINENPRQPSEPELCSEIIIRRKNKWHRSERMQVLYFTVKKDKKGSWNKLRFQASSDSLIVSTKDFSARAESHYLVFTYVDQKGGYKEQKVFNHVGIDITDKLGMDDPPRRILLFVNGYRPTSVGHTFEENFADIQAKGLEFPNSRNLVYTFDRYEYWRPWNQMDVKFQKRINPSETYYADGHFSVSTSNHRSLINFTTTSAIYPKRCSNPKKHHCYTTRMVRNILGKKRVKTISLHRTKSNKRGFKVRKTNGHVAGRNIYQLLNEIPNGSKDDTLYIVAHSMGYAYALGIIDELRGKINFGGLYIIAPENASAGNVRKAEWKEVWQFGCDFNGKKGDAPCLLDGVAPQTRAGGLTSQNRIYIPKKYYKRKGYFDSHFIGYYTWIFDIPRGKRGYVSSH